MGSWTLSTPTTTSIWLVLLGVGFLFAGKVLFPLMGVVPKHDARTKLVLAIFACWIAGILAFILSVLAYFFGVA